MKYLALIGIVALLAVLIAGGRMATQHSVYVPLPAPAAPTAGGQDVAAIGHAIASTEQLETQLNAIAARAFATRSTRPIIAYMTPVATTEDTALTRAQAMQPGARRKRLVTLLYSGVGFDRAVVDGKYVRVGDRLPGGGRVLDITDHTVVVRDAHGRAVLHVPGAHQAPKPHN